MTVHQNDGSYLAHTQGRKHQTSLARRAAREQREGKDREQVVGGPQFQVKKNIITIGRPGYKVTKIRDPLTQQVGLLFQIQFPEIALDVKPRVRFMSAFEQKVEEPDRSYQYLLVAAEPYETCAFKLESKEIDRKAGRFFEWFDQDRKEFWVQVLFKNDRQELSTTASGLLPPPGVVGTRA